MRQYERSGVTVDQCTECRAIFLDRGELEKLFEAESAWNRQQAAPQQPQPQQPPRPVQGGYAPPPPPPPTYGAPAHVPPAPGYGSPAHVPPPPPVTHGYPPAPAYGGGQHGYHGHYRQKKHKSFLNELFD